MKKGRSILVFTAAMMFAVICHAAVRTVDNNGGAPNNPPFNYNNISDCINAATTADGDIIYVKGSATPYGDITCDKQLTFIGTGFNPASYPQKQNTSVSVLGNITLHATCSFTGFRITSIGVHINGIYPSFTRCEISGAVSRTLAQNVWGSISFHGCHLLNTPISVNFPTSPAYSGPLILQNCILNGQVSCDYIVADHCIFLGATAATFTVSNVGSTVITNCIFYRSSPGSIGASWYNNTSYQCTNNAFPPGSNNQAGVDPMFVNFPPAGALFHASYDFHFLTGSPCIGSSNDLTDRGVWGGTANYYSKSGMPALPNILQFTVTPTNPTIPAGAPLNVNIVSKRIQ